MSKYGGDTFDVINTKESPHIIEKVQDGDIIEIEYPVVIGEDGYLTITQDTKTLKITIKREGYDDYVITDQDQMIGLWSMFEGLDDDLKKKTTEDLLQIIKELNAQQIALQQGNAAGVVDALKHTISGLQENVKAKETENIELKAKHEADTVATKELIDGLNNKITGLEKEMAFSKAEYHKNEKALDDANAKNEAFAKEMNDKETKYNESKTKLKTSVDNYYDNLFAYYTNFKQQHNLPENEQINKIIDGIKHSKKQTFEDIIAYHELVKSFNNNIFVKYDEYIEQMADKDFVAKNEITDLEKSKQAEFESNKSALEQKQTEIDGLNNRINEQQTKIEELTFKLTKYNEMVEENNKLKTQIEALTSDQNANKLEFDTQQKELDDVNATLRASLDSISSENKALESTITKNKELTETLLQNGVNKNLYRVKYSDLFDDATYDFGIDASHLEESLKLIQESNKENQGVTRGGANPTIFQYVSLLFHVAKALVRHPTILRVLSIGNLDFITNNSEPKQSGGAATQPIVQDSDIFVTNSINKPDKKAIQISNEQLKSTEKQVFDHLTYSKERLEVLQQQLLLNTNMDSGLVYSKDLQKLFGSTGIQVQFEGFSKKNGDIMRIDVFIYYLLYFAKNANAKTIDKQESQYKPFLTLIHELGNYVCSIIKDLYDKKDGKAVSDMHLIESAVSLIVKKKHEEPDNIFTFVRLRGYGKTATMLNKRYDFTESDSEGVSKFLTDTTTEHTELVMNYDDNPTALHDKNGGMLVEPNPKSEFHFGPFSRVFVPTHSNEDIVDSPQFDVLFQKLLKAEPVCIIGYGPSGSGKTSTLIQLKLEDEVQPGIVQIMMNKLSEQQYKTCTLSAYELESDTVSKTIGDTTTYEFKGGEWVKSDDNKQNMFATMVDIISNTRKVAGTPNNPVSSRSHVILQIKIKSVKGGSDLNLLVCDFAGVENIFDCANPDVLKSFMNIEHHGKKVYQSEVDSVLQKSNKLTELMNVIPAKEKISETLKKQTTPNDSYKTYINLFLDNKDKIIKEIFETPMDSTKMLEIKSIVEQKGIDKINVLSKKVDFDVYTFFIHLFNSLIRISESFQSPITTAELKKKEIPTGQNTYAYVILPRVMQLIDKNKNEFNYQTFRASNIKQELNKMSLGTSLERHEHDYLVNSKKIFETYPNLGDTNDYIDLTVFIMYFIITILNELKITTPKYGNFNNPNFIDTLRYFVWKSNNTPTKDDSNKLNQVFGEICAERVTEGKFINKSLSDLRGFISSLIMKTSSTKMPTFINDCMPFQCDVGFQTCFGKQDYKVKTDTSDKNGVLADKILALSGKPENLTFCIFTVINLMYNANNPPNPPYLNIAKLQRVYDKIEYYSDIVTSYTSTSEHNTKLWDINDLAKDLKSSIDEIKASAAFKSTETKNPEFYTEMNELFESILGFINKSTVQKQYTELVSGLRTILSKIDKFNSTTVIGALEFTDNIAKYGLTQNVCDTMSLKPYSNVQMKVSEIENKEKRKSINQVK